MWALPFLSGSLSEHGSRWSIRPGKWKVGWLYRAGLRDGARSLRRDLGGCGRSGGGGRRGCPGQAPPTHNCTLSCLGDSSNDCTVLSLSQGEKGDPGFQVGSKSLLARGCWRHGVTFEAR